MARQAFLWIESDRSQRLCRHAAGAVDVLTECRRTKLRSEGEGEVGTRSSQVTEGKMKQSSWDRPKKNHQETSGAATDSALPQPAVGGEEIIPTRSGPRAAFPVSEVSLCRATRHLPSPQTRGLEADARDGKGRACDSGAGRGDWPAVRGHLWACLFLFPLGSTGAATCRTRLGKSPTPRDQRKSLQQKSSQTRTTSMLLFPLISNRNLSLWSGWDLSFFK